MKTKNPILIQTEYKKVEDKRDLNDPRNMLKLSEAPKLDDNGHQIHPVEMDFARQGRSAATDWMEENGFDGRHIIEIQHDITRIADNQKEAFRRGKEKVFHDGVQIDTDVENKSVFETLGQGASAARRAVTLFATRLFKMKFIPWYCCGMEFMKLVFERSTIWKIWIYILQAFSTSTTWKMSFPPEVLQVMPEPSIDRTILMPDLKLSHGDKEVTIVDTGHVKKALQEIKETDSDGNEVILVNPKTDEEYKICREKLEPFTTRAPGNKGNATIIIVSDLIKVMKRLYPKWNGLIGPDKFGHFHRIEDIDMIWFYSSFKWSKVINTEEEWELYKKGFKENGHHVRVCKQAHPFKKCMAPCQFVQTFSPDKEEEEKIINFVTKPLIKDTTIDGAIRLIRSPWQRAVARIWPEILGEQNLFEEIQASHIGHVWQALTGCIPHVINYVFCLPDSLAIACHICNQPIMTLLDENQVHLDLGKIQYPGTKKMVPVTPYGYQLLMFRNPTPGLNIKSPMNVEIPEDFKGLYLGNAVYVNVRGDDMRSLSMDYDGDTVGVLSLYWEIGRIFKSAIEKSWKKFDYRTVYFENAAPPAIKFTKQAYADMLTDEIPSEVGLIIDAITRLLDKMMAQGATDKELFWFSILEAAATQIIDAAKNGEDKNVGETIATARNILKETRKIKSPMHTFWKKQIHMDDFQMMDYDLKQMEEDLMPMTMSGYPRYVRRDNWMGRYTKSVRDNVPGKVPVDQWVEEGKMRKWIAGAEKKVPYYSKSMMLSCEPHNIPGLFSYGMTQYHDHKTDWSQTVFGRVVGEYLDLRDSLKNGDLFRKAVEDMVPVWKERIYECGFNAYYDHEETVSNLVHSVYMHGANLDGPKKIIASDAKTVLWLLFGEQIYNNVCNNLNIDVSKYDLVDMEDDGCFVIDEEITEDAITDDTFGNSMD